MSPKSFRSLLISSLILGLVSAFLDLVFPEAIPDSLRQAQAAIDTSRSVPSSVSLGVVSLIACAALIASYFGLFTFKPWAPRIALISTVIGVSVLPLLGYSLSSGWAAILAELSSVLWGAVLALAYFSPLKECFRNQLPVEPPIELESDIAAAPSLDNQPFGNTAFQSLRHVGGNLLSGLRGAAFVYVKAPSFHVSWAQLVALVLLSLAPALLHDFITHGLQGRPIAHGLPGVLFMTTLVLFAAWALARLARQPNQVLLLIVAFMSLALPIDAATTLFRTTVDYQTVQKWMHGWGLLAYYFPYAWLSLAAGVAAIRLLDIHARSWAAAVTFTSVLLGLPLATVWHDRTLWAPPHDETAASRSRYFALVNEDAFYLQPKLLDQELAAVERVRKSDADLYFVGGAGDSSQDVFMKEIVSVAKLFEDRFDTRGHTIRLINNPKTVTERPIVSATSLRASLKRVGEVMNRDQDILFLYLTSHGTKETGVALDYWPLQFNSLAPRQLREILDSSGIKNRVIVVAACYAGIYVEPMKNEDTLIITAASADKKSFGCSNEAASTYFGKAYFDEALRTTYSFVDAFETAKRKIAERERQEGDDSSDPQIFVGGNIKRTLAGLEDRLKQGATRTTQ